MACNDSASGYAANTTEENSNSTPGSCYPTGCPPCSEELSFPENPSDGQRYCISIGTDENGEPDQKCWVYDKCVPGWRAEGPALATTQYKGTVDVCTVDPPATPQVGDWWVISADCSAAARLELWGLTRAVVVGDRIAYNGSVWQAQDPPAVPYASEALGDVALDAEGKPTPDNRVGGIVKIASLSQAKACTEKCDVITPYTLCEVIDDKLDERVPTFDAISTLNVLVGAGSRSVCISNPQLSITATAEAKDAQGDSIFASYAYQWKERSGNTVTPLSLLRAETVSGATSATLTIEDLEITPVTGSRTFFVTVTATDLFNNTSTADSGDVVVTMSNALEITAQPTSIDLSSTTTGSMTVGVGSVSADLPAPAQTVNWFFNGVKITGATTPDLGYTFSNWTTTTLGIERTDETAGSYAVYSQIIGGCNATLTTPAVTVKGPGGIKEDTGEGTPPFTPAGAVGSYTIFAAGIGINRAYPTQSNGNNNLGDGNYWNPFKVGGSAIYTTVARYSGGGQGGDDPIAGADFFLVQRIE